MFQDSNIKMKLEAVLLTSVQGFSLELGASLAPLAADVLDKSCNVAKFLFFISLQDLDLII